MYRHVFVCAFIVIVSDWCTLTPAENAEMPSARRKDPNATCIDIGDCPTVDTDCQEKSDCDKRIPPTYDKGTSNCEIDIKLLIKLLKEKNNTEAIKNAEMSSARSKDVNATCIDIGDCPTVDTDCQEKCGCDKRIPSTYDKGTNNCEIDIKLLIKLLKEENNTEASKNAEMSSERSKDVNFTCINIGDCAIVDTGCLKKCGCDKRIPFTNDNGTNNCEINIKSQIKLLIMSLKEKYNTEDKNMSTEDDVDYMTSRLRAEADRIFKGVIVAAFLFIACASVCTLTACIYCCRMNYTDYQLKKSVKVLARKMGKKSQLKKRADKAPTAPIAESCNVVVEDAGVFCV